MKITRFRVRNQKDFSWLGHSYIRMHWTIYIWINTSNPWPLEAHILLGERSVLSNSAILMVSQRTTTAIIQSEGVETNCTNPNSSVTHPLRTVSSSSKLSLKSLLPLPLHVWPLYRVCTISPSWPLDLHPLLLLLSSHIASSGIFLKPVLPWRSCLKFLSDTWLP